MANTIQIKRSSTASDTPSASDLAVGELAVNTADAKLFTKHTDGTVKELAGGGGGGGGSVALDDITTGDAASTLATTAGNITIDAQGNNTDIIFKGTDNTADITFLTMDGSETTLLLGEGVKIQSQQVGGTKRASLEFASVSTTSSMIIPNDNGTLIFKDLSDIVQITSTDTGASADPTLDLYRNSSSPAVNDLIGHITFSGENDASEKITYAEIQTIITDETDGTEDSSVKFNAIRGGSSATYYQIGFGVNQFHKNVLIESSDTGNTENPTLDLYRNSASPADQDVLGAIHFSGENDASEKVVYAKINADIIDQTDATEDGRLDFGVMAGGTVQNRLTMRGNGVTQFVNKDVEIGAGIVLRFEGSTGDDHETSLTVVDPTTDRTITLPDASGTVLTTGNSDTPVTTTSSSDADFVLVDDGGTMKKITPSNLGIGGGGGGVTPSTGYFDCYLDNEQSITSTGATIQYDVIRQNVGSAFSLSSSIIPLTKGELTISVAGTYMVTFQVTLGNNVNQRTEGQVELQLKPSGGSFADVEGTLSSTYNRNNNQDETTASTTIILTISANDTIRVFAKRNSGTGNLKARADGCRFNVFRIA